jgi:hypothetical protein
VSGFLEASFDGVEGIEGAVNCQASYCTGLEVRWEVSLASLKLSWGFSVRLVISSRGRRPRAPALVTRSWWVCAV